MYTYIDGRNHAPVDRQLIPFFTGFYTSQVEEDFVHQQFLFMALGSTWFWYHLLKTNISFKVINAAINVSNSAFSAEPLCPQKKDPELIWTMHAANMVIHSETSSNNINCFVRFSPSTFLHWTELLWTFKTYAIKFPSVTSQNYRKNLRETWNWKSLLRKGKIIFQTSFVHICWASCLFLDICRPFKTRYLGTWGAGVKYTSWEDPFGSLIPHWNIIIWGVSSMVNLGYTPWN